MAKIKTIILTEQSLIREMHCFEGVRHTHSCTELLKDRSRVCKRRCNADATKHCYKVSTAIHPLIHSTVQGTTKLVTSLRRLSKSCPFVQASSNHETSGITTTVHELIDRRSNRTLTNEPSTKTRVSSHVPTLLLAIHRSQCLQ